MDVDEDFQQFVRSRQRDLLRTAWWLAGDWAGAEDLVQTALIRAWPHWRRISRDGSAEAYVRKVMVNVALDWRRRRWTQERPTDSLPETSTPGVDDDLRQVLIAAVRSLPPRQRAVIVLRYFDDLPEAETAAALNCSPGTVKSQASKALATLRRQPALADLQLQRSHP